jgi:RNA polymerase sigma-70 factor (ECF subfamily)
LARGDATDPLDDWVLATAPRAVAYAASLLRDRHQAEDVVQDCYCRLLQKADVYDLPNSGVRLLFKAITRTCINLTTRRRPVLSLQAARGTREEGLELEDRHTAQADQVVQQRELEQAVGAALAQLPARQRAALELRSLGHSQQEIAELLEVSPSHAGVLVHRARQMMANLLTPVLGETQE